jgi:competence protein ComEC
MLLSADAWNRAWRPSLRTAVEALAFAQQDGIDPEHREAALDDGLFVELTGVLRTDAAARPGGVSLEIDARTLRALESGDLIGERERAVGVRGGTIVTVVGVLASVRAGEWRAGRLVRIPVRVRRPSQYRNPGVPDYERALARRGITLVGSVKSGALVEIVAPGRAADEWAAGLRAAVRRAVASSVGVWSAQSAAIVTAVVIGDRAGLDDTVERRLQEAGTYHVLAISGGNIAILVGVALLAFRLAGRLGPGAMLIAAAGLSAYGFVVGPGGGASVTRATLMAVIYLLGRAVDLVGAPVNTLAVALAVILAVDPLGIADPGLQLTVGATLALVVVLSHVRWTGWPPILRAVGLLGLSSVVAEVALLPVGAAWFSRVTVAGLLLNFAAIPLMAVVQLAGMAGVVATVIAPPLAPGPGWVAHHAATWLVTSSRLVDVMPILAWRVAPPSVIVVAAYYAAIGMAWVLSTMRPVPARVAIAVTLGAGVWIVAEPWTWVAARGDGRLHVTFIDVGQGDATLVRFPRGRTLLVDAGGLPGASFDVGDRVVAPVLRHAGVRRLDIAAMTHAHPDHAGGLAAVAAEFRPRELWDGVPVPRAELRTALRTSAQAIGARWTTLQAGDTAEIDGVRVIVRHPPPPGWERQDVRNDDSLVIELAWGDASIVLAGDIGREVEGAIAGSFAPARLRVMTAPHHGSLTSSSPSFIDALAPRVVVASAGRGNTFGHPAPDVLARYERAGARVFRTDRDGAITVETDGRSLVVRTFTGGSAEY